MRGLCFIDTETTSLRPDRRIWEIAIIHRDNDGNDEEYLYQVGYPDLDLGNADPESLAIGHFYERHYNAWEKAIHGPTDKIPPEPTWLDAPLLPAREWQVLYEVEAITRNTHLVGNVVSFDAEVLANRMRANAMAPSWHYHLIDIESMIVGWLHREAWVQIEVTGDDAGLGITLELPWRSEALSTAIGVDPARYERHTAMGDARWVRDQWDVMMKGAVSE